MQIVALALGAIVCGGDDGWERLLASSASTVTLLVLGFGVEYRVGTGGYFLQIIEQVNNGMIEYEDELFDVVLIICLWLQQDFPGKLGGLVLQPSHKSASAVLEAVPTNILVGVHRMITDAFGTLINLLLTA